MTRMGGQFIKAYSRSKFQRGSPRVKKFARNKFLTIAISKTYYAEKRAAGFPCDTSFYDNSLNLTEKYLPKAKLFVKTIKIINVRKANLVRR